MKNSFIKTATCIGLIAILTLQAVWLYNTYNLTKKDISNKASILLEKAIYFECCLRMKNIPGVPISSKKKLNTNSPVSEESFTSGIIVLNEGLTELGYNISLNAVDSIYAVLLSNASIPSQGITINHISTQKDKVLQCVNRKQYNAIETDLLYIRYNKSEAVQATLLNPYWILFQRMGLLMVATAILTVFVIICIIYQIKIINRQNKIAKIREDFSYAMIHEMKTPLTSILAGVQILHSGKLTDQSKVDKHFRFMREAAEKLLSLTNKVLTISRLEKHQLELEKDVVSLEPMIADLIEKFSVKSPKATFAMQLQTGFAYADSEYLMEAISNLIDNSIKYSGEHVHIIVSAEDTDDGYTLIKVLDNGHGIAPENQKKIFEKYERAAAFGKTRKGGAGGFGLGLNYVQNITEAHGGRVLLESIEGEFSEFQIYIPHSTEKEP